MRRYYYPYLAGLSAHLVGIRPCQSYATFVTSSLSFGRIIHRRTKTTTTHLGVAQEPQQQSLREDWSQVPFSMTINGKAVTTTATDPIICPATGEPFASAPIADIDTHLDLAVQGSYKAFQQWKKTTIKERQQVMEKMAHVLEEHKDELGLLLSLENGKPLAEGIKEAGPRTGASLIGFSNMLKENDDHLPIDVLVDTPQQRVEVHRRPFGIVACIIPWNFPLHSLFQKLAPAMLAGNVCIVKPSSATPLSTLRAFELLRENNALGPPGLVQVLSGPTAMGQAMVKHPKIPKISFTGSTSAGIDVSRNAVDCLKRLTLELGGNDAAIVLDDVIDNNLQEVAQGLARAAFANSGQVCHALKRLYVHESIHEELCNALAKECATYRVGHPLEDGVTHGPLTTRAQLDYVMELVDEAVANGAHIVCGGDQATATPAKYKNGFYYPPTILTNVQEGIHRIVMEEQFGPVLPVLKFSTPEEAIERANASEMGLTGSIWTTNELLGEKLVSQLEAGTGFVNHMSSSHGTTSSVNWPSQGYKMTGMGCNRGMLGLLEYTQPQTINRRKL